MIINDDDIKYIKDIFNIQAIDIIMLKQRKINFIENFVNNKLSLECEFKDFYEIKLCKRKQMKYYYLEIITKKHHYTIELTLSQYKEVLREIL